MLRVIGLVFASGCSFALMKGPPAETPARVQTDHVAYCTSSYGLPVVMDFVLAAATAPLAIGAGYLAGDAAWAASDSTEPVKAGAAGAAVGAVAMAIPVTAIASAVWGYRTANRCSTYQIEQAARLGAPPDSTTSGLR